MIRVRHVPVRACERCTDDAEYEMCDQFSTPFAWYCEHHRLEATSDFLKHRAKHSSDSRAIAHWDAHERVWCDTRKPPPASEAADAGAEAQ